MGAAENRNPAIGFSVLNLSGYYCGFYYFEASLPMM
jgi:hypothetical protein